MTNDQLVVLCSAMPGFLRSVTSGLARQCRLLECYSLTEAGQMIQLHQPQLAIVDLRRASARDQDRTWAMIQNSPSTRLVAVCCEGEIPAAQIPEEIAARTLTITSATDAADLREVAENSLRVLSGEQVPPPASREVPTHTPAPHTGTSGPLIGSVSRTGEQLSSLEASQRPGTRRPAAAAADTGSGGDLPIVERYRTRTPELRTMLQRLEVAARHDVTILLIGETGSGKTHLARLIHEVSPRQEHPFVIVACGALPGDLIESELFGHVKGAFTSAHADKDGKFLAAGRGTILLDEIDVLTPEQQVKLLRVIEKGEFEPVGSNRTLHVQARIIAASNLQLQPLVEEGRFRPDLYYRLNTLSFRIPPLRDRLPDIEPLARYFVHLHAGRHGIEISEITDDFLHALSGYPWPGNVREMENAIRSAVIFTVDGRLNVTTLPPNIVDGAAGPANDPTAALSLRPAGRPSGASLNNRMELTEKDIIERALLSNNFSRTRTAKQLGISRVTLYNKMKKYGMMPQN